MDTQPVYELRERLRAASIAGTNLLSEDFRLKRAYESFKPLEAASPVFAKIGQLLAQIISPDCKSPQGTLLDALSLIDAVICTLGAVEINSQLQDCDTKYNNAIDAETPIINVPYSALKELIDALTTSGSGHYDYVCSMRENHPEYFKDYRIKYALVQALGASYAELADKVSNWLAESKDMTLLSLLYKDFDPRGKKEMVRRVSVIEALAGADANDFYIKMLNDAQKDVRLELINALQYEPENITLLLDMAKTERGKNKDKVHELLADFEDERAYEYFKEMAVKKPELVLCHLKNATTKWSSEIVASICNNTLDIGFDDKENLMQSILRAMYGKGGKTICECYRRLLSYEQDLNRLFANIKQPLDILKKGVLEIYRYAWILENKKITTILGKLLHHSLMANPDTDLQELALELYQGENGKKRNIEFLPAVTVVKFINNDISIKWFDEQITDKVMLVSAVSTKRMQAIVEAASYVRYNENNQEYEFCGCYTDVHYPDFKDFRKPIKLADIRELAEWFKQHSINKVDEILSYWIPLSDKEMCRNMGEYYYKTALTKSNNSEYLDYMNKLGWTECKGLATNHFKHRENTSSQWAVQSYLKKLPGDTESKRKEAETLSEMIKTGKINQGNVIVSSLDEWIMNNL